MAETLAAIYQNALEHPNRYYYLNELRAERWRKRAEQVSGSRRRMARFRYGSELLKAGQTQGAIRVFEDLLQPFSDDAYMLTLENRKYVSMLGISYLRLGEQQNCIINHTAQSCILPLRGGGIHTRTYGSRQAISIYEKLLRYVPTDLQSRWLLNLAYMTLGKYPDGVPDQLLIPGLTAEPNGDIPRFSNVAPGLGVAVNGLSGGVSLADFNEDGFIDIFVTSYGLNDPVRLFLADGRGGFVDYTEEAGLEGIVSGLNTIHADYNNDGYVDIFILRGAWLGAVGDHPNSLLRNNGDGTFTDVTFAAGLGASHPTQTAAFADFNNDGWLDLFVGNESNSRWLAAWSGSDRRSRAQQDASHPSELFVNNGDGTFTEVPEQVGINVTAFVKGVAWGDVNNDGLPDLYISILGGENRLYMNRGGTDLSDWQFEEVAKEAGVQEPYFSFPVWFWDYNNDGWQDIFVASYDMRRIGKAAADVAAEYLGKSVSGARPRLYRNDGDGTFTDVTEEVGLDKVLFAMGANYGDLNNDGYLDFYIGTGAPGLRSVIPNRMFLNHGGKRFEEVTFDGGFGHVQKGHAIAFADFDRDGDQDIYAVMGGAFQGDTFQNALFENPGPPEDHSWITLLLEGRTANRSAIGARIKLTVRDRDGGRRTIYRTVSTGGSFGASSLQQEIGLGRAVAIEALQITWPNREHTVDTYTDLEVNGYLKIVEGAERPIMLSWEAVPFQEGESTHAYHTDVKRDPK